MDGRIVDHELVDFGREEIAHHAKREVGFLVESGRRRGLRVTCLDLTPQPREELDVGGELRLPLTLGVRSQDEAPGRQRERAQSGPQPIALLLVTDATRDADVLGLRHEHEISAGQRDERGDPRALGAERLLRDLHEHVLAARQHLLDGPGRFPSWRLALLDVDIHVRLRGRRQAGSVVAGIEECVLGEADIHERGLHPRQHVGHDALVHAADDRTVASPLEIELGE